MHIRYLVILNYLHGLQNVETTITFGLCAHTVGSYIRKHKEGGLQSLVMAPKPGASHMLTKEQEQLLVKIIATKTPDEVGFPSRKNWNATYKVMG